LPSAMRLWRPTRNARPRRTAVLAPIPMDGNWRHLGRGRCGPFLGPMQWPSHLHAPGALVFLMIIVLCLMVAGGLTTLWWQ
jgi:hypothetical protein